jgi:hypothetical protein
MKQMKYYCRTTENLMEDNLLLLLAVKYSSAIGITTDLSKANSRL